MGRLHQIGFVVLVSAVVATSTFAANPDQGETLVKRWCAGCHLVAADQKGATTEAPTFASVAKRPDFDAAKIAFFLVNPHAKMANMQLSRDEAADIAAYIATLKQQVRSISYELATRTVGQQLRLSVHVTASVRHVGVGPRGVVNPYFAGAREEPLGPRYRRHRVQQTTGVQTQAIKLTDAVGRTCVYVPITENGKVVDSKGYVLDPVSSDQPIRNASARG